MKKAEEVRGRKHCRHLLSKNPVVHMTEIDKTDGRINVTAPLMVRKVEVIIKHLHITRIPKSCD